MKKYAGMTLIEILITLALVALLATFASVVYIKQAQKGRRIDGIDAILTITLAEERYRANNPQYGSLLELGLPSVSPEGYYELSIAGVSQTSFTITATAKVDGPQANDTDCSTLQYILNNGSITRSPNACWAK